MEEFLKKVYYDTSHPSGFGGVDAVYRAVQKEGVDISRKQVTRWLRQQPTYTLHKPIRRRFKRNRVIVGGIDDQWQADLVDVASLSRRNNGYRFLLTCIDIFSKYAWVVPLGDKTGTSLINAFKKILQEGRKPRLLQTDKGTEFTNRKFQSFLQKKNIEFFTTHNETKASVVERFNRTLKTKMWKYFTAQNTYNYAAVLPRLVSAYNRSFHRSIKRSPASVAPENSEDVWQTLYGTPNDGRRIGTAFKFNVGDTVRISMVARTFSKGYLPNWTTEIFTVSDRIPRDPPVYKLKDYDGEELKGTFYEQELQRVDKKDDLYEVEKVLQTRKRHGVTEYLVQWVGYPSKFNSWVRGLVSI